MNACNETLVAKIILMCPDDIKLPFYENMYFINDDDEKGYDKIDKSVWMMETLSTGDILNFGTHVLNLPSIDDIFKMVDKDIDNLLK